MYGYQLTFFTQQSRQHNGTSLGEWLLQEAHKLGIRGATVMTAVKGFGHDGRLHSAHFFELSDQPLTVTMVLTQAQAERIIARLHEENIKIFFVKTAVEYGTTGEN